MAASKRKQSRKTSEPRAPTRLSQRLIKSLQDILKRYEATGARLRFPGEGGERPFRAWLVTDFLCPVLGWNPANIVVGERFDILLRDADGFPVATIETKTPYHKASKKERQDFENRLSGYGTLRHAYFTNGATWERLDIFSPAGRLEIQERFSLALDKTEPDEVEAFFTPLVADRYLRGGAPRQARHHVGKDTPHILEGLAADLHQAIGELAQFLFGLLNGIYEARAGAQARNIALNLFDLLCDKSLIVSPGEAGRRLADQFKESSASARDIATAVRDLGLTGAASVAATEGIGGLPPSRRCDPVSLSNALWPAYEDMRRKLCSQTAHVVLARALLYRIGEDQRLFPRVLSGEQMEDLLNAPASQLVQTLPPATNLLDTVPAACVGHQFPRTEGRAPTGDSW